MITEVLAVVASIPADIEKFQCSTPLVMKKETEYADEVTQHVADILKAGQ
jgi:hypothetical protein